MSVPEQGIKDAIAAALEASKYPTEDSTDLDSWNTFDEGETGEEGEAESTDGEEGEPGTAETQTIEGTESEAEEGTDKEVPEEYWGVDLRGIPEAQREAIIAKMEGQEGYIHRLQERLSQKGEETSQEESEEPVNIDEVSDVDLLKAAGYDPEDFNVQQMAPVIVPMLRQQLKLEEQVETLSTKSVVEETERFWNGTLDSLENDYGKLPFDRVDVLKYALDEGIGSPYELYFRISAPARQEVSKAAAEARRAAGKAAAAASPKPRKTATDKEQGPVKPGTNLRDAVKLAMVQAEKETGHRWKDAIFGRITSGSE